MCTTVNPFFVSLFLCFLVTKYVNMSRGTSIPISRSLSSSTQVCADKGREGCTQWDLFRWVQVLCEEEVTGMMALGWKPHVSALPTYCSRYHCAPLASGKETLGWLCAGMVEEFSLHSHVERIQARGWSFHHCITHPVNNREYSPKTGKTSGHGDYWGLTALLRVFLSATLSYKNTGLSPAFYGTY